MDKVFERQPESPTESWSVAWSRPLFRLKFMGVWLLLIPLLASFHSFFRHIERREGPVLNDWVLNHIPAHNVSLPVFLLIWGAFLLGMVRGYKHPNMLLVMLWSYLFVTACRVICILLIPLDPPQHLVALVDPLTNYFYGKDYVTKDLFFSGHTSSVFVVFLGLRKKSDKLVVLFAVISLGILLLVQHVHYTIDVLAAPLFAYGAHRLAETIKEAGQKASPS